MAQDTNGEAMAVVAASQYREDVLARLQRGAATPSTIAEATDYHIQHISRSLQDLRDVGLVELLVPEETKKGRLYGITDDGEAVAERLDIDDGEDA